MPEPQDLALAAEFCKLVDTADLLEYLGLPRDVASPAALDALAARRKHMQAMQANPKFKDSAKALIKGFAAFQRLLGDLPGYLADVDRGKENEKLPMLEMAIDSILVDGVVTANEEAFVRQSALNLGISLETYERVLRGKAEARGVAVPNLGHTGPAVPPVWAGGAPTQTPSLSPDSTGNWRLQDIHRRDSLTDSGLRTNTDAGEAKVQGAAGYGWWDAAFTRLLLDTIPGGPGDMVDVYCRTALSALTVLPARRQLSYVGVDRSAERLDQARKVLPNAGGRVQLLQGEPHAVPIPDESVDFVLAIRAMQNCDDTRPIFAEAMRVLRPGGRLIVAEPDGLSERFYFDGPLVEYNEAFARLCAVVDDAMASGAVPEDGRPGLALGPRIHGRMRAAGLKPLTTSVHGSNNLKERSFGSLVKRLRGYPATIAKSVGLSERLSELSAVMRALDAIEVDIPHEKVGLGGNVLPMFLTVGVKD